MDKYPEWKQLYDVAQNWQYGTQHDHAELSAILKLPKGTRYYQAIHRCNKELLEKNRRCLASVRGVGYRVAESEEHLTLANGEMKRAAKRMRQTKRILDGTDLNRLSDTGLMNFKSYYDNFVRTASVFNADRANLRLIAGGNFKLLEAKK